MLNGLQPWHLIILVLVVVLLFGAKRLPDAARSIGKSMKIFKAETKDLAGQGNTAAPTTTSSRSRPSRSRRRRRPFRPPTSRSPTSSASSTS